MNGDHGQPPGIPGGAVPLGGATRIAIREQRIIVPGVLEVREGGLSTDGCDGHLRIIDLLNGVAWLYPMGEANARMAIGGLSEVFNIAIRFGE